jgi:hypothetical protein
LENLGEINSLSRSAVSLIDIYQKLASEGKISMGLTYFYSLYNRENKTIANKRQKPSDIDAEFLQAKDKVVKMLNDGKSLSYIFKKMTESGEITMSYSSFLSYSARYGIKSKHWLSSLK